MTDTDRARLLALAKDVREKAHDNDHNLLALCDAIPALLAQNERLRAALRQVLAVCADRQAFVMEGPRAFARAARIAEDALRSEEGDDRAE